MCSPRECSSTEDMEKILICPKYPRFFLQGKGISTLCNEFKVQPATVHMKAQNCSPKLTMYQATNANYKPNTWDSQANRQRLIKHPLLIWVKILLYHAMEGTSMPSVPNPTLSSETLKWPVYKGYSSGCATGHLVHQVHEWNLNGRLGNRWRSKCCSLCTRSLGSGSKKLRKRLIFWHWLWSVSGMDL